LAVLLVVAGAVACFGKPKHPMPALPPVRLEILNHAFADVDVFVLPSPSGTGLRLTTVNGSGRGNVSIRTMELQPGGILQLELHAVGSRTHWRTASLTVVPGEQVVLEIQSDAYGNLSRSTLYPGPDGSEPPPPPV
jgi:hypothetical protein